VTDTTSVRATLEASTGTVLYSDLVAHLRRSAVFVVAPSLALADAAAAIALDDAPTVTRFLDAGLVRRPTDEEQRAWAASEGRTWLAIIVQPFVLVTDPLD
jgi:hypothetical protein